MPQFFQPDYKSYLDTSGYIVAGDDISPSSSIYAPINSGTFGIDGVRPDGTTLTGILFSNLMVELVSFWELEEASGIRYDSQGSNNLTDNNTVTQAAGKVGNAAHFEDDNSESLSSSSSDFDTAASSFTLSGWFNFDNISEDQYLSSRYLAADTGNSWFVRYNNGNDKIEFLWMFLTYARLPAGQVSAGTWYFVTIWYDADAEEIGIQLNDFTPVTVDVTGQAPDNLATNFVLGNLSPPGTAGLDGKIDQIGFWRRVLTSAEIDTLYNGGTGLTYAALTQDTPDWVSDKWGNHESALYMEIDDNYVLQMSGGDLSATKGSIYITYRPDYIATYGGADKYLISGADFIRLFYDISQDRFAGEMWNGSDWTTVRAISIQQNFVSGTWIHLAMVYDNTSGLTLYVSGTEQDSVSATWDAQTVPSNLSMGCISGSELEGAHGAIDNFKVFKRTSDASEVLTIYGENMSLD
jgi:hypothetical protein